MSRLPQVPSPSLTAAASASRVGEPHASPIPGEQTDTGLRLEAAEVVADRGLRVAKRPGGRGERAVCATARRTSSRRTSNMADSLAWSRLRRWVAAAAPAERLVPGLAGVLTSRSRLSVAG